VRAVRLCPLKVTTMNELLTLAFNQPDMLDRLATLDDAELDALNFGVIGFDAETLVCRYNSAESRMAGLSPQRVLGQSLFTAVAPCMNNFLVAQRFEDAATEGSALDATIDYVFTLRMRPSKVKLRLLAAPGAALRYVLVHRPS
jgi:photoactive yellow protein